MVERDLGKIEVIGSIPIGSSSFAVRVGISMVESLVANEKVAGSSPVRRTICPGDGIGIRIGLRSRVLRVRLPPWAPI